MVKDSEVIDLIELSTRPRGEALEFLAREIGKRLGMDVNWSGRGADQGRDLIFIEIQKGPINSVAVKWLVQCKDNSASGKSVTEGEVGSIIDKVRQHKANGFLLITTTTAATSLKSKLDGLDLSNSGEIQTQIWDKHELLSLLLQPGNEDLIRQYFPKSYDKYIEKFGSIDRGLKILKERIDPSVYHKIEKLIIGTEKESAEKKQIVESNEIAEILEVLRIEKNEKKAVSLAANLEIDEFSKLTLIISTLSDSPLYHFLLEFITSSNTPDLILYAFQLLNEEFELTPDEKIKLSKHLDNDALYRIYGDEIINWLITELIANTSSYSIWSEIDTLSSASFVDGAYIDDISFNASHEDRIDFSGSFSMDIGLISDKSEDDESIFNAPGEFSGYFDAYGTYFEKLEIDTSEYYK